MTATPIRFASSLEHEADGEAETRQELVKTLRGIISTTSRDYGHAVRSVHAKSHALLEGEMVVPDGLPPELAQGAFARPGTFPVVLRVSTNPGDILNDNVSVPRGLALKVIGVEGERLPGSEDDVTQDFVMANAPAFSAPDAAAFLKNLKLLAATTDRGEAAKGVLSAAMRGANTALKGVGINSPTVTSLGGQPLTHPLGETFWSQTPLRWGDYVAKVSVAPASPNLKALEGEPISLNGNPNALRQSAIEALADDGGEWEVRVQLLTNPETMPVEDASVVWPEDESPYRPVARIRVPAQPAWNEGRAERADDRLAFAPWHGLAAHRPLGSINRARRPAYDASAAYRAELNGDEIREPREAVRLSTGPASSVGTTPGREGFRNARRGAPRRRRGLDSVAGLAGGLVGGLVVSAVLLAKQQWTGRESDLVRMGRRIGTRPLLREDRTAQARAYGSHLLLSAASGALYGAARPEGASPLAAGLAFGAGLGAVHEAGQVAMGGGGPVALLSLKDKGPGVVQHMLLNTLFGLVTALVAERTGRALRRKVR